VKKVATGEVASRIDAVELARVLDAIKQKYQADEVKICYFSPPGYLWKLSITFPYRPGGGGVITLGARYWQR